MNENHEINDRVAVAGRRGRIQAFDRSPFGGVVVGYDDGGTEMVQPDQLESVPITDEPLADTAPEIDPGLSATDNFLRAFPA